MWHHLIEPSGCDHDAGWCIAQVAPFRAMSGKLGAMSQQGHNARTSVLVVEDEPALRATIISFLREEGFAAQGASDGQAALNRLEQEAPDVLILDMWLPRLNGWDLTRKMRERGLQCKLIVMTAAHSARTVAEQLGADAYVPKPFALLQLLRAVERCEGTAGS
jgi:DNA-binding response OmpR family regulator